jgi:hypothetical protein
VEIGRYALGLIISVKKGWAPQPGIVADLGPLNLNNVGA